MYEGHEGHEGRYEARAEECWERLVSVPWEPRSEEYRRRKRVHDDVLGDVAALLMVCAHHQRTDAPTHQSNHIDLTDLS